MDGYTQFLVVVLATFLVINLILWIVLLTKAIKILNDIKKITAKAEDITEKAAQIGTYFKKTGGLTVIVKLLHGIIKGVRRGTTKGKKGQKNE